VLNKLLIYQKKKKMSSAGPYNYGQIATDIKSKPIPTTHTKIRDLFCDKLIAKSKLSTVQGSSPDTKSLKELQDETTEIKNKIRSKEKYFKNNRSLNDCIAELVDHLKDLITDSHSRGQTSVGIPLSTGSGKPHPKGVFAKVAASSMVVTESERSGIYKEFNKILADADTLRIAAKEAVLTDDIHNLHDEITLHTKLTSTTALATAAAANASAKTDEINLQVDLAVYDKLKKIIDHLKTE
jgi:phage FluMu protein Com